VWATSYKDYGALGRWGKGDGSAKRPPHKTRLICVFMIHTLYTPYYTLSHNSHGHNVSSFSLFFTYLFCFYCTSAGCCHRSLVQLFLSLAGLCFYFLVGPRDIILLQSPTEIYLTYSSSLSSGFLCHLKVFCPWAAFGIWHTLRKDISRGLCRS